MIDEVHERTTFTDIIMGLMKKILKKRKQLKLIISSATLDVENFIRFFDFNANKKSEKSTCFALSIKGRSFSIDTFYLSGNSFCLFFFTCRKTKYKRICTD